MLPADDLYARLELPVNASPEAIEIAWRALLKRHHPDVAGSHADDLAKRINVAHDWLSDPELRARYDSERHPGRGRRGTGLGESPSAPHRRRAPRPPAPRRPIEPAEAVERHLARVRRLSQDELDRLSLAESPPIAFVASISRFLSADQLAAVEGLERRVQDALPPKGRWDAATRDAVLGYAHELLLGPFLDAHLSEPFRERVRERLARGWESAVDQPRYGPNTAVVVSAIERLRALGPTDLSRLAVAAASSPTTGPDPWPRGLSPVDDDALRVSSALAQRDAAAALPDPAPSILRRSVGRAMHGLVLRHAFKAAELSRLLGPWDGVIIVPDAPARPTARRR
ncbi:MAG TPA: J domain-containing protein [Candidatus Limnocylindrales bacterium]|nr:J domain-containing protein [Candidatus Limnocylindrales bacterium]